MGELLEVAGGLAQAALIVAFVLWILHFWLGSQVFGVPALIGVLVVFALGPALNTLGPLGTLAIAGGLLVLLVVIGMAMTLGAGKPPQTRDEKPKNS